MHLLELSTGETDLSATVPLLRIESHVFISYSVSLAQEKQRTLAEVADTLGIVQQQVDAVNEAIQEQKDPWDVYPILPNVHRIRTDFEFW